MSGNKETADKVGAYAQNDLTDQRVRADTDTGIQIAHDVLVRAREAYPEKTITFDPMTLQYSV